MNLILVPYSYSYHRPTTPALLPALSSTNRKLAHTHLDSTACMSGLRAQPTHIVALGYPSRLRVHTVTAQSATAGIDPGNRLTQSLELGCGHLGSTFQGPGYLSVARTRCRHQVDTFPWLTDFLYICRRKISIEMFIIALLKKI